MTRSHLLAVASLLAAAALGASSLAQQPPREQRPGGSAAGAQQGENYPMPGPLTRMSERVAGPPWPVIMVTSVEVLRFPHSGGLDVIRARGLATSNAWTNPHLVPITRGQPIDGVLDVLFEANAPDGPVEIGPFMPIESAAANRERPSLQGRARAGGHQRDLAEGAAGIHRGAGTKDDCSKCVGKYFLAKDASPPAGVPADQLVHEADLAWTLRIIRPTDGIRDYVPDPNRLTLVLSGNGRIVDAGWD